MVIDQADQRLGLPSRRDLVEPLVDRRGSNILPLDGHGLGIARVPVDEFLDLAGEGRREEDRLALLGCRIQNLLDVVAEAHVEHPVGLVKNGDLEVLELEGAALQVVDDATGGADDDLDTLFELEQLAVVGGPAVDGNRVDRALESSELVNLIGHLLGEFACGTEDQDLDGTVLGIDLLDSGDGEGGRLAGARLGLADKIAAGKQDRDGGGLDRGSFLESELGHRLENFGRETQTVEALFFHVADTLRRERSSVTQGMRKELSSGLG